MKIRQKVSGAFISLFCFAGTAAMPITAVHSESITELIGPLLKTHNLIKASEATLEAAEQRVKSSRGGWFPTATVTTHYGKERQNKPTATDDTDLITRQADISVTQLVWDFCATNSLIEAAKLTASSSDFTLEATRQDLILRAAPPI